MKFEEATRYLNIDIVYRNVINAKMEIKKHPKTSIVVSPVAVIELDIVDTCFQSRIDLLS